MTSETWNVRRMDIYADLESVREISQAIFSRPGMVECFHEQSKKQSSLQIYVVCSDYSGLVGYCAVLMVVDELHIHELGIHRHWRRRGVGSVLFDSVIRTAKGLGASKAGLEVRASNLGAIRFYGRFGFELVGKRKQYYSDPVEDALILWLDSIP